MKTPTLLLCATLGLTLGFSAVLANSADAKAYKTINIGSWKAKAHVNSESGAFTHCTGSARYNSGIKLIFSISKNQKWGIGFSKNSWTLKSGKQYPVRFQVDRKPIRSATAKAVGETLAFIKLPGDSRLFAQMRRGRTLKVEAGDDLLKFSLKSTNRLLKSLLKCSIRYKDVVASVGSNDPFGDTTNSRTSTSEEVSSQKSLWRKEARMRAESLLAKIDVKGHFIEPTKAPNLYRTNDSVWSMGKFMGTMRIHPVADVAGIDTKLVESEKGKCHGDFKTRTKPTTIDGVTINMRSAICNKNDGTQWVAFYTLYPRSADSSYLLTVFTTKSSLPDTLKIGEHLTKVVVRQSLSEPVGKSGAYNVSF